MPNHPKIEKGVEMPQRGNTKHEWLDKMEIGDSFVVFSAKASTMRTAANNRNIKLMARRVSSNQHRMWRVQ